jgi:hypothetical protein
LGAKLGANGLVFASTVGTPLDDHNVRRQFRVITEAAGHKQAATTELVYRHQIVPALTRGAEVMDQIFG